MSEPLADSRDMFAAHAMFRREFGLMPGLVRTVTAGDEQRAALVADHIALLSAVLNHHHMGEDDFVWPPLLERCPREYAAIVHVMDDQHEVIHLGLAQVEETAAAWRVGASADARDSLAAALGRLIPVLKEHLALEEERVVPLIERYVTQAEYDRAVDGAAVETPPDKLAVVFGMFMYEAAPEIMNAVVARMPAEVQPVIRDVAAEAYAAYAKELYGTATPGLA
ncbi:MAG: hemerythrin domain-containing protein [Trebonia sp.]